MKWYYEQPVKIIFGAHKIQELSTIIQKEQYKKGILVTTTHFIKNGFAGQLLDDKKNHLADIFAGFSPNPDVEEVNRLGEHVRKEKIDFIIALGGGSVIDTSKAVAHGTANPDTDIWEFWSKKQTVKKSLPVGVVLTLAAAGSETSDSAVLTNEETKIKRGLSTDFNRPAFAIMNPELTYTLPKYQVGCGIVDIMMHTLDRYFTQTENNELTDEIAEGLLRTVIRNGAVAIKDSQDYNAMSEIMWAGSLSHNGITGLGAEKDFAVHQLGHELSAKFDIAHGASLSAVWGAWAAYVYDAKPSRFAQYARRVWNVEEADDVKAAQEGIRKTVTYFASLNMPTSFREAKEIGSKTDEEVKQMAHGCSYEGTRTIGSFKVCDENDIYEIYKLANK